MKEICQFVNDKMSWLMIVDGETIPLTGENHCKYLAKKFEEFGYEVTWDREKYRYQETIEKINGMTHIEMCRLFRYARSGHPYFDISLPYNDIFMKRFREFGGFTPTISKQLMEEEGYAPSSCLRG